MNITITNTIKKVVTTLLGSNELINAVFQSQDTASDTEFVIQRQLSYDITIPQADVATFSIDNVWDLLNVDPAKCTFINIFAHGVIDTPYQAAKPISFKVTLDDTEFATMCQLQFAKLSGFSSDITIDTLDTTFETDVHFCITVGCKI